jgi:hypothetical protein
MFVIIAPQNLMTNAIAIGTRGIERKQVSVSCLSPSTSLPHLRNVHQHAS